jgi:death-on-curing family protein
LIKNHPFENGNKRIAVMSLFTFLALNNKWISMPPLKLYELAFYVAGTNSKNKVSVLKYIQKIIENHLINLPTKKQK